MGAVKCPCCKSDFEVSLLEAISDRETLEITIGSDVSELIRAELVGETMQSFAKVLRETGRALGGAFEVYVLSVEVKPKAVTIKFVGSHPPQASDKQPTGRASQ